MRNNEDNLFMSRKKNPSFAEWTLQNGVSKKPAATNVGVGVPDNPHSQTTQRATAKTTTPTQQTDPFLEGFYSTEDKPKTERKTYLQHREKTKRKSQRQILHTNGQPRMTQTSKLSVTTLRKRIMRIL